MRSKTIEQTRSERTDTHTRTHKKYFNKQQIGVKAASQPWFGKQVHLWSKTLRRPQMSGRSKIKLYTQRHSCRRSINRRLRQNLRNAKIRQRRSTIFTVVAPPWYLCISFVKCYGINRGSSLHISYTFRRNHQRTERPFLRKRPSTKGIRFTYSIALLEYAHTFHAVSSSNQQSARTVIVTHPAYTT